jgi:hypothetical protein
VSLPDMHTSDDLLVAAAMGDSIPDGDREHLADCDTCSRRLAEYARLLDLGAETSAADVPQPPSAAVWAGIVSELGLSSPAAPIGAVVPAEPASPVEPAGRAEPVAEAQVIPMAGRRARWTTSWLVAAVAIGVVGGAALTALGGAVLDDGSAPVAAPSTIVTAEAALSPLPDKQGTGRAEIVETPDGDQLVVDVSDLSAGDGFYEVWLIDPKTFEMVGLGALTTDEGRFAIPDGLDLSQYRVVDVSIEPFDGNPVHSRDSVVRGELNV